MIQEPKRPARIQGFYPEGYLAELYSQGIQVNTIDAMGDHIAQGLPTLLRRRFGFAGANDCKVFAYPMGSRYEKMA